MNADWPLSPDYDEWVESPRDTARAWILYKLGASAWHIDLLATIGERHGFSRLVGVEMALDGALAHLSSAFDAAVANIIVSAEARQREEAKAAGATASPPLEEHKYNWWAAKRDLERSSVIRDAQPGSEGLQDLVHVVSSALDRDPNGWLTTLRDLRNRTTHRDTLARHIDVHVGPVNTTDWQLTIAGVGVNPVAYLRGAHEQLTQLIIEHMLPGADVLTTNGGQSTDNTTQSATIHPSPALAVWPANTPLPPQLQRLKDDS